MRLPYEIIIPAIVLSLLAITVVVAIAARKNRGIRPWVVVTALGVAALPVAIVLHNILSAVIQGEEGISFVVALTAAPLCIAVGMVGASVVLLRERSDLAPGVSLATGGIGLVAVYSFYAVLASTIVGGDPDRAGAYVVLIPLATLAMVVGALWSLFVLARGSGRATA